MKKIRLITLLILFAFATQAQTKVLFLGNSFTYAYNIPGLFHSLSTSAGISVFVDVNAQSGMAVADEGGITGHANDPVSQAKIVSQKWDYIVVQDNQGDYANTIGYIPTSCVDANKILYNQIKANDSCTRIIYFAGWGPVGGVVNGDNTQACVNRTYGNMLGLNNSIAHEIVTPISKSWNAALNELPSVNLYYTDDVHPSLAGSYLAASTIFTTIFKMNPANLSYTGGVSAATAKSMRFIADSIVTEAIYLTATNLRAYTPTVSVAGNVLTVNGNYSSYQWYKNGTAVGADSGSYIATASANYQVVVTNSHGCPIRSMAVNVTITGVENHNKDDSFSVYPNPNNGSFTLSVHALDNSTTIEIKNILGQVIYSEKLSVFSGEYAKQLDMKEKGSGVYFVSLKTTNNEVTKKVIVY